MNLTPAEQRVLDMEVEGRGHTGPSRRAYTATKNRLRDKGLIAHSWSMRDDVVTKAGLAASTVEYADRSYLYQTEAGA